VAAALPGLLAPLQARDHAVWLRAKHHAELGAYGMRAWADAYGHPAG
jgi:hypothetical protein